MKYLVLILAICLVLLFVGGPGYHSPRSYQSAWDLGHILLFSILTYLLIRLWKKVSGASFVKQCASVLAIGLIFGAATEFSQNWLQARSPSFGDMVRNLAGCLVTLAFLAPSLKTVPKIRLRAFQLGVLVVLVFLLVPLSKALIDETIAGTQFPVLADFETPFERDRWTGGADFEITRDAATSGESSMRIQLTTDQYSGVNLRFFPRDWREFGSLKFDICLTSSESLSIVCRIHDIYHYIEGGSGDYYDRFNRNFTIEPGWNHIQIPLDDVAHAPKERTMDLSRIDGLGIFVVRLPKREVVYLDHVRLEK